MLSKDVKSNQIKFKVDRNKLNGLPAGKYRTEIDTNIDIPGNKPKLLVNISEYFDINSSSDSINMIINNPTKEKHSNSINWTMNTNCNDYNVKFESKGFKLKDN